MMLFFLKIPKKKKVLPQFTRKEKTGLEMEVVCQDLTVVSWIYPMLAAWSSNVSYCQEWHCLTSLTSLGFHQASPYEQERSHFVKSEESWLPALHTHINPLLVSSCRINYQGPFQEY
jgi:hypothetical protein